MSHHDCLKGPTHCIEYGGNPVSLSSDGHTTICVRCALERPAWSVESHDDVVARQIRSGVRPVQPATAEPAAQHNQGTGISFDKDLRPESAGLDVYLAMAHDLIPVGVRAARSPT